MNLSKRWKRMFSIAIVAIMIGSMIAVFPAIREALASTPQPTAVPQQVISGKLINVYVNTNEVKYVGVNTATNTIYLAMSGNSNSTNTAYNWTGVPMYSNTTALTIEANAKVQIDAAITDGHIGLYNGTWLWGTQVQEGLGTGATGYVGIDVFYLNLTTPPPKTVVATLNALDLSTGVTQTVNVVIYVVNSTAPLTVSGAILTSEGYVVNSTTINTFTVSWNSISGADSYTVKVNYTAPGSSGVTFVKSFTTTSLSIDRAVLEAHGIPVQNGTYTIYVYPYNATWNGTGILFPGGKCTILVDAVLPTIKVLKADLTYNYSSAGWSDNLTAIEIQANGTITSVTWVNVTVSNATSSYKADVQTNLTSNSGEVAAVTNAINITWEYQFVKKNVVDFKAIIGFNENTSLYIPGTSYTVNITVTDGAGNVYWINYKIINMNQTWASSSIWVFPDAKGAGEAVVTFNVSGPYFAIPINDSYGTEYFPGISHVDVNKGTPELSIITTPTDITIGTQEDKKVYESNAPYYINVEPETASPLFAQYVNGAVTTSGTKTVYPYRILKVNGESYDYATTASEPIIVNLNAGYINVTYMDFNVSVGTAYTYQINVIDVENNALSNSSSLTPSDSVPPWMSTTPEITSQIYVNPPGTDVSVPLNGSVPTDQTVVFTYHINGTHLWYFNVTYATGGSSVGVSIEFPDSIVTNSPTITVTNGLNFMWIKEVNITRSLPGGFDGYPISESWTVKIYFEINSTYLPSSATSLAYTWSLMDYGANKCSEGPLLLQITNHRISISGEQVKSLPQGNLYVSWSVSPTTNYQGFIVVASNNTLSAANIIPSPTGGDIWPAATNVTLTYEEIIEALGASQYNGTTNIYVYVITDDGHYDVTNATGIVDNELPELCNATITYPGITPVSVGSSSPTPKHVIKYGESINLYLNVTDKYTGVQKIVVDASSFNSTGTFVKYFNLNPALVAYWSLSITDDKNVTGYEPITIKYYDMAGNVNSTTLYVYVDNSPPSIQFSDYTSKIYAGGSVEVKLNVTDKPAGVNEVEIWIANETLQPVYGYGYNESYLNDTYTLTAPTTVGTYTIYAKVTDGVGNSKTYVIGTVEVYPATPAKLSVVTSTINGKPTGYTPSQINAVYVGDTFKLVATIEDQYGNVLPSNYVKLQWKIVVENSSGSAVPISVPEYGDYAVFKALTMGKIEFEVYLLQYVDPITQQVVNVNTQVYGKIDVYVIPGVNEVKLIPTSTELQVGKNTTVKVETYYVDSSGQYFTQPIPAPFAKVTLTASAGSLPDNVTTDNSGVAVFTYTAPTQIGVPYTTVTLTASSGQGGDTKEIKIVAGPPAKMTVTGPTSAVATVPITLTVSLYDEYGNPAYGAYDISIQVVNGSSYIAAIPSSVTYDNGSVQFTIYTSAQAYGQIVLNLTTPTLYKVYKISVLPLPDVAKISAPTQVEAYTGYNITVTVYNSTYGVMTPGALVKLYEDSSVYGMKYVGEGYTNAQGTVTILYYPSLFKQDTNVTLIAEAYVNGTLVAQGTAKVLVKAYWPKVLIEKVVGPVPLAGSVVQPGRPFYIDITLKSETYLPTNITVYVSLYKSGTGIEAGTWLITTAYVQLGPDAEKTVRIFMILPYNAPTGNWTMVITLHDWDRFIHYGPQGSVLPWAQSRTYIVFQVYPPGYSPETIQATEVYIRRFD